MDEAEPFGTYAPTGLVRRAVETTRGFSDGWLARRCIIALRRLVMPLLRGKPVDIEALGARMRVLPYANICEKRMLFAPQTFDPRELEILAGRLRDGFVFLDVGANVGSYSLFVAARAGPSARILAVEPQPGIFERLIHNIRLNSFANIKAVACAVADRDGEVTLFIDRRNSGASSVKIVGAETAESVRVPAKRLLSLLRDEGFHRVDAMKLDIEGAEDIVLPAFFAEAPEALRPSLLIIENAFGRWQGDLPALLAGYGYREVAQTRMNLVLARDEATTEARAIVIETVVTAAILVIGDEILSGRTKDKNIGYIAEYLTGAGIDVKEVRVVPDVEVEIVGAVNALRARFTYVFTTGGIGPTHDDITADCVAKAFGVPIDVDPRAVDMLLLRMKREDLNEARLRMARIPEGAELVENPISRAPGFRIGNVIVMAGVPAIMQAMLDNVVPTLIKGVPVTARTVDATGVPEGRYAAGLADVAKRFPGVMIGSYPSYSASGFTNQIIARGRDLPALDEAVREIEAMLAGLRPAS